MWLIYALGGGWGHLTRAVALASVAQVDRPVRVLTNSAYASLIAAAMPALDVVMLNPCAQAELTRRAVQRVIAECRPECLVVDTFPRGIGGELAGVLGRLDATKVLVHRDLNPRYVTSAGLREFVTANYDLVLVPGAGEGLELGDLPITVATTPWLVRSADQLPDRSAVRSVLRLSPCDDACILVCASGNKDELDWYGAVYSAIRELNGAAPVRVVSAERPPSCAEEHSICYWPAMDLFGCASVVVGGAGYNIVRECAAWGVPLVAKPWPRMYDRQELRARNAGAHARSTIAHAPEAAAKSALEHFERSVPEPPRFVNGAIDAVRLVARFRSN